MKTAINPNLQKQLKTQKGFFQRFWHHLADVDTDEQAYDRTEEEYQDIYYDRRYCSYKSFRAALNRFNRQQLGR
jgi:hypothetical protein